MGNRNNLNQSLQSTLVISTRSFGLIDLTGNDLMAELMAVTLFSFCELIAVA